MISIGTRLAASTAVAATLLAGCGAGQVSQVATQEPAVNGTVATVHNIALRNVHLQAVQTGDEIAPGTEVELVFSAANLSPDVNDKLVKITSDIGTVTLAGDTEIEADELLNVGVPDGVEELGHEVPADSPTATVQLTEPIQNGLTYNITFEFKEAGRTTVAVPISAGNAPRQDAPLS